MTAVLDNQGPRPRQQIRLAPVPITGPPFDDELGHPGERSVGRRAIGRRATGPVPVQGSLALTFELPSGVPAVPSPPPRLRVVGHELAARSSRGATEHGTARPDVARWAAMVVQAAVEVMAGDRPLTQMARWTTTEVYEQLQWRRRSTTSRPPADATVLRRAVVSSVHVCQPDDDVAEACATVRVGDRASAVALRLEADRDAWRCTAIALG